jgi:hypothetical protein
MKFILDRQHRHTPHPNGELYGVKVQGEAGNILVLHHDMERMKKWV